MTVRLTLRQRREKSFLCAIGLVVFTGVVFSSAVPASSQRAPRKSTKAILNGALLRATEKNRISEVKSLLAKGANSNVKGPLGYTPIMLLALHPNLDAATVQALQKAGGNIDALDTVGTTALMHACANGSDTEARVLLARGAKPNIADPNGNTALMTAAEKGGEKIVPLLLSHGAKVDLQNRSGQTALFLTTVAPAGHFALTRKFYLMRVHIMQMLLDKGANVNLKSTNGTTPLMMAASNENVEMVEALLKRHADVKARDAQGLTALKLAMQHKSADTIVRLLKQAGATE
jgi:ankyrin repeat protein